MSKKTRFAVIAVVGALALFALPSASRAQLFDSSNWSFEKGMDNWTAYDPVDRIGVSTDYSRTGTNSLKFATTGNTVRVQYDVTGEGGVDAGITYTGRVWYYISSALSSNESIGVNMTYYDVTDSTWTPLGAPVWSVAWGPDAFGPDTTTVGTWMPLEVSGIAPAGVEAVQFGMQVFGRGSSVYFDDMQIIPEPATGLLILGGAGALAFLRRRLNQRCR